ncbi:hypothetical protein RIF29_28211 [Crotalaria pallida]|uniref:Transmembrane protein n=1 Tax=Crotalaria pallida TaxID=3830 RepID=A0AAN9EY43_CROPI
MKETNEPTLTVSVVCTERRRNDVVSAMLSSPSFFLTSAFFVCIFISKPHIHIATFLSLFSVLTNPIFKFQLCVCLSLTVSILTFHHSSPSSSPLLSSPLYNKKQQQKQKLKLL